MVVNYHASQTLAQLALSLRAQCGQLGLELELLVVDHSESPEEAARLFALRPEKLLLGENRGYAAGINRGVQHATGELLLLANPDVVLLPQALEHLLAALQRYPIVGPKFYLGPLLYPLAEGHFLADEARQVLAYYGRWRRRRWWSAHLHRSLAAWRAVEPVPSPFLSGAMVLCSRPAWERVGPWDEGYFLYYEETDWLLRAHRLGLRAAYVPRAEALHLWGVSAHPLQQAPTMVRSRRRFLAKNFGLLGDLLARVPLPSVPFPSAPLPRKLDDGGEVFWFFSPTPLGVPSFGFRGEGVFPEEVLPKAFSPQRHPSRFLVGALSLEQRRLLGPWRWDA